MVASHRRVRWLGILLVGASLWLRQDAATAQEPAAAANPNDLKALLERMDRLEKQNAELQKALQEQRLLAPAPTMPVSTAPDVPSASPAASPPVPTEASGPPDGTVTVGDGPAGPSDESKPKNIQTEKGLLSRGVWETAIERRILGPGRDAGWDQGFFLKNSDASEGYLRFGGDFETDYRGFPNRNDGKDIDTFLVRRARITLDGIFQTYYDYKLMIDFSQKQTNTNTQAISIVQDAYINIHYWDAAQLEIGKFKSPLGFEQLIQDRATPFLERSMFDQLLPARDVGIMAHGEYLLGGRLDWAANLANGEVQNLDSDQNDKKDFIYRVALRPFNGSWKIDALSHLQFTCEGSIGDEHENFSSTAAPGTGFTMRTPATVPWLAFNNATATATAGNDVQLDGLRTRFAPSVSYFGGPVGLAYQYYYERQEMQLNTTGRGSTIVYGVPLTGYDLLGSVLLTGETRTSYTQPLNILHPFDPLQGTGYGAVELAARVSRAAYDPIIFEPFVVGGTAKKPLTQSFANPIGNTSGATEMTLGINWYWNRYVKFQFNYEYDWFDQPVSLGSGPNNVVRQNSALLGRVALVY